MSYSTYEFTAYTEADLLDAGAAGHSVNCGDTFTMPAGATTCIEVTDNDRFLSGDNHCNEQANDHYGQQATITGADGNELGNGGQIYAEKYFWVCDDAGNWYVMIEVEQEGSNDDFFTFYTGHGYTVPEEGTELTVYSQCNVKGEWIDYKCLDAGEKPEVGSISGRVFCDDDCDGIDGGVTIIEGCDYTIEAEDMDAWGFKTVHGDHASGGELVKLQCAGEQAAIKTNFQGKDGVYDISLFIQDETDGQSTIKLLVNGHLVEAIRLDNDSNGVGSNNGGFTEFVIQGVELKAGDEVKLWADGDGYEWVRIDKLEFNGRDEEVRTEEPGKEGVVVVLLDAHGDEVLDGNGDRIETVTDANGEYTFDGVPVGDYRVKFENPDGTEFTFQNAGSDDAIDSDVNGNGVSDVVTVVADQTTSDVDAGLKPVIELGSIAGRYFCDENQDGAETDAAGNLEAGVAGATVWLLQGGQVIGSTTTDADGNYIFEGLEAGNYSVRFEDPDDVSSASEGKNFIAANQGDDATDSDVVNVGGAGNGNTANISLAAGENKTDVDAGIEQQFMVCDDPNAVLLDFEGLDGDTGFEAFTAGQVIDDEYSQFGVTITAERTKNNDAANDAMIFDSANPTGGDTDLQTFNQGNLLIVSEDNDSGDPDDAIGGVITFDFANPSRVFDLKVVDTEEEGGTIELFDADGNSLGVFDIPALADGGLEQVMIDVDGVSQMVVTLVGSGAIDDICIVPGQPEPGSLSGRYFFDADRDGLDNDGMNGIEGILVELLDENGDPTGDSVMTDAEGNYSFGGLDAGTYGVKFTDPATGRELTTQNVDGDVSDDIDSDAGDIGGGMSTINGIVVVAGEDTPDNDAGVVDQPGSISGTYFCDDNRDGDDDGAANGDADVAGQTVMLFEADGVTPATDIDGNPVAAVLTDANGDYSFENLGAGDYVVMFEAVDGKSFIAPNVGDDATDSDVVDAANGKTAPVSVVAGEDTGDVDAGVETDLGSLSGRYFFDADRDGLDNDGANGISGITVELLDENGDPTGDSVTTGADGSYSFGDLLPGTYGVKFTDPATGRELTIQNANGNANDDIDSDASDVGGGMSVINGIIVVGNQNTPNNDAGVVDEAGSLSGTYFCDDDRDGVDDGAANGDADVAGKTVMLLDANGDPALDIDGNPVAAQVTDANGDYRFTNLAAGAYVVMFASSDAEGKEFIAPNVGDDADDSDVVDLVNGKTGLVDVLAGEETTDVDAGVEDQPGSISGTYFCDDNDNDVDDGAPVDPDVVGRTVTLLNADGSPALDIDGNPVAVAITDANGDYSFENLGAGDYVVMFEAVPNKSFVTANVGDDATDSDVVDTANGKTAPVTVVAGEDTGDVDAGVETDPGSLSGRYFFDADRDGLDNDGANGISGILVELLDENGDPTGDSVLTGADGSYSFGDLDPGTYGVKFTDPATGRELTIQNANGNANDDIDSDAGDIGGGMSQILGIEVVSNQDTPNNDAGVVDEAGSLSGTYFCDDDRDGVDDGAANGDADVAGKTVMLFEADGVTPATDIDGNPVAAQVTDANGDYRFTNLAAGAYVVMFASSDAEGKEFIAPNVGDDADDSDVVDLVNGKTGLVDVLAGEETTDVDAGVQDQPGSISGTYFCDDDRDGVDDGAANGDADIAGQTVMLLDANGDPALDIDGNPVAAAITDAEGNYSFDNLGAGDYVVMFEAVENKSFIAPNVGDDADDSDVVDLANGKTAPVTVVAGEDTGDVDAGVSTDPGSLSGRYFCDVDGDGLDNDGPDNAVAGQTVELLDANGQVIGSTTTAADGSYSFTGLQPGVYGVQFPDVPLDKDFTTANVNNNGNDDIDSDVIANDFGTGVINNIVVVSNQDTPNNDAGITSPNQDPNVLDVAAAVCADETATINLLDAVSDPDGDMVSIASISDADETADEAGESITLETGAVVTLNGDGTVTVDPSGAYDDLVIRDSVMDQFQFTAVDGEGGMATGDADIKVCGALNTIETIAEGFVDANGDPLQANYQVDLVPADGTNGISFPTTVTADAPLDPRLEAILGPDGERTFDDNFAYCVDEEGDINFGEVVPSNLYIVGDDAMNTSNAAIADAVVQEENLDIVTWILNQRFQDLDSGTLDDGDLSTPGMDGDNYTFIEVQNAIWFFTDGSPVDPSSQSQEIIDLAITAGEGFVASEDDDLVAVLFDPIDEDLQTYIVGVEFETLKEECDCVL